MRSLFSARSFADRAAARRAEKGAEDDDRPEARAAAAGPESAERAAPAGPSPVSRLAGGGIFKAPGVRGPVRPAATPQPVSPAEPGARHEERRAEGEDDPDPREF